MMASIYYVDNMSINMIIGIPTIKIICTQGVITVLLATDLIIK